MISTQLLHYPGLFECRQDCVLVSFNALSSVTNETTHYGTQLLKQQQVIGRGQNGFGTVLWIHFILIGSGTGSGSQIHTGKRYPDFFNRRRIFKYFFTIFMLKLHEPFRDKDFLMVTFFNISYLGFERKRFSFAVFVDICTWIGILTSIFLRIRIQEAKIMRIHQIRILSTAWRS